MKAIMFFGSPIKLEESWLAEKLANKPPEFTEEHWNFDEPFTDPACQIVLLPNQSPSIWHLYAGGSMHIVDRCNEPLRFDPMFLHRLNGGNMMTRRLQAFCKLTGLTFRWAEWFLALQPE